MRVTRIQSTNFRNLGNLDVSLTEPFTILVGPNAAGKTNFLETIYYASVLQAFPPGKTWELIAFGENYFRLLVEAENLKLEYYYGKRDEKRFVRSQSVDGVKKKSDEIAGTLPTVTFVPQDLNLFQLSPAIRRAYLDEILIQSVPGYEKDLAELDRVLSQRNELLSRLQYHEGRAEELDFWDQSLGRLGERIAGLRGQLVERFSGLIGRTYSHLTGTKLSAACRYVSTAGQPEAGSIVRKLEAARSADISAGRTSIGPHRDDWILLGEDDRNLAHFLSRGEQRSVIISLKVMEYELLSETLKREPVVLLDELLAELDRSRQEQILKGLPAEAQVLLTATDAENLPEEVVEQAQIIEMNRKEE